MIFVNFVSSCGHWLVIWTIFHKSHWSGGKWLARPGCIVLHRIPCKHQQNISARTVSHQCSVSPWAAIVVSRKIVTIRNLCNCISVLFTTRQPRWLTLTSPDHHQASISPREAARDHPSPVDCNKPSPRWQKLNPRQANNWVSCLSAFQQTFLGFLGNVLNLSFLFSMSSFWPRPKQLYL